MDWYWVVVIVALAFALIWAAIQLLLKWYDERQFKVNFPEWNDPPILGGGPDYGDDPEYKRQQERRNR